MNVWMNGILVGQWKAGAEHSFQYNSEWLNYAGSRPLSLSIPLTDKVYKGPLVEAWFDNLLPDSDIIRKRIQSRYSLPSGAAFSLLSEIGRDCAGAVQLLPEGSSPGDLKSISGRELSNSDLAACLNPAVSNLSGQESLKEFRISLAGAQEKTAFLYHRGKWMIPEGTTPTTHIFKLPLGVIGQGDIDLSTSVENEWLCSKILELYGMDMAESALGDFGTGPVLVVKRFDRRISQDGSWIIRLPQEDFCQALGTSGALKYESDGGPGVRDGMNLLRSSLTSEKDRITFFKSQILFQLLAATDGHAKNFSIFLLPGGRFRLAPLYDVMSLYPVLGSKSGQIHPKRVKMAMAVPSARGKSYNWDKLYRRHWIEAAAAAGLGEKACKDILDDLLERTPTVLEKAGQIIPAHFPESVALSIIRGVRTAAERLDR